MQEITPKDKQIEIARFCGFFHRISSREIPLPDYFGSLDAIHYAQEYLPDDVWPEYWDHLSDITGAEKETSWGKFYTDSKLFMHATAAQHAEALYRVISSSEESDEIP